MSVDTLIDELGGTTAVAAALGLDAPVVSNWRSRGIPPKRWPALLELAGSLGKKVTLDRLASIRPEPAEARA